MLNNKDSWTGVPGEITFYYIPSITSAFKGLFFMFEDGVYIKWYTALGN